MVLIFTYLQIWTFMHLYYPHSNDNNSSSISAYTRRFLSPSRRNSNSNEKYFFSIFHWVVIAFPHLVTFVHWVVLVPRNEIPIPSKNYFLSMLKSILINIQVIRYLMTDSQPSSSSTSTVSIRSLLSSSSSFLAALRDPT